jgi:hypothetical protein
LRGEALEFLDLFGGPPRGSFLDQAKNEHGEGNQAKQSFLVARSEEFEF